MSIERACCTCQWWDQKSFSKDKRNTGWCRILPPRNNGGDESYWGWPLTYDEDWCGRWQAREEAQQKMHDPVLPSEEQYWRSRGDSERDIASRIARRGRA